MGKIRDLPGRNVNWRVIRQLVAQVWKLHQCSEERLTLWWTGTIFRWFPLNFSWWTPSCWSLWSLCFGICWPSKFTLPAKLFLRLFRGIKFSVLCSPQTRARIPRTAFWPWKGWAFLCWGWNSRYPKTFPHTFGGSQLSCTRQAQLPCPHTMKGYWCSSPNTDKASPHSWTLSISHSSHCKRPKPASSNSNRTPCYPKCTRTCRSLAPVNMFLNSWDLRSKMLSEKCDISP